VEREMDCPDCEVPMTKLPLNGEDTFKCMKCGGEITQTQQQQQTQEHAQIKRAYVLGLMQAHMVSSINNVNTVVHMLQGSNIAPLLTQEEHQEVGRRSVKVLKHLHKCLEALGE
jgi:uncharacterized paraquat-inducible protein A